MNTHTCARAATFCAALGACFLTSCADHAAPPSRSIYHLQSINGRLPAVVSSDAQRTITITAGQIVLESDGTSRGELSLSISRSGQMADSTALSVGRYRLEGDHLILTPTAAPERTLSVRGDTLTEISDLGHQIRYVRSR